MAWQLGLAANAVVMIMYAGIAVMVSRPLRRTGAGWRDNPQAWSIVLIFTTCSLGHGAHMTHLLGATFLAGPVETLAARASYDVHLAIVDITTAVVATVFWSLKLREQRAGAPLYDDTPSARRAGLRVNEDVVQGLALAGYQLDAGDGEAARATIQHTLDQARALASDPFSHREPLPVGQLVPPAGVGRG